MTAAAREAKRARKFPDVSAEDDPQGRPTLFEPATMRGEHVPLRLFALLRTQQQLDVGVVLETDPPDVNHGPGHQAALPGTAPGNSQTPTTSGRGTKASTPLANTQIVRTPGRPADTS
jgi:hypothetical protein